MRLAWLYALLGSFSRLHWSCEVTGSVRACSIPLIVHLAFEILSLVGSNHLQGFWKLEIRPIIATMEKMIKKSVFFFSWKRPTLQSEGEVREVLFDRALVWHVLQRLGCLQSQQFSPFSLFRSFSSPLPSHKRGGSAEGWFIHF